MMFPAHAVKETNNSANTELRYDVSASSAWYPYFIPDAKHPGIVVEIVKATLKEANISGRQVELPPKRTILALSNGELDFDVSSPSWFVDGKIPDGFVISEGLLEISEFIVTLPQNASKYRFPVDIKGKQIGTVRGYYYNNDRVFNRVDFISEKKLIQALTKGRIEAVIMGDLPAYHWAKKTNIDIVLGPVNSKGDLHIRFREKHAYLIPKINQAITRLKSKGKVSEILSRYVISMSDEHQSNGPTPLQLAN